MSRKCVFVALMYMNILKKYIFEYFIMHTYKSSIHKSYVFSFSHVPFKPTCQFFQSQSNQQNQVEYEWESVKRWLSMNLNLALKCSHHNHIQSYLPYRQ